MNTTLHGRYRPVHELVTGSLYLVPGDCRRGDPSHHAVEHDRVTRPTAVVGWRDDPGGWHYSMGQVRQADGEDIYH